MLIPLVLTAVLLLLYAAPEAKSVKALRRILVDQPVRLLSRPSPAKLLFGLALSGAAIGLISLFEGEGVKIFAMMSPEAAAWFAMFDVATITDALIFGLVVSASVKLSAVVGRAQALVRPFRDLIRPLVPRRARDRTASTRTATASTPPRAEDPDGWPGLAYAG